MDARPRDGTDPVMFQRFMAKVEPDGECWRWTAFKNWDGYGVFGVKSKAIGAHRAAYMIFSGDIPAGLCVLHSCDRPWCVNPAHLYVGTQLENVRDRVVRGRSGSLRGEAHGRAKLTSGDVANIRAEIAAGAVQRRLAERYGVTPTTILGIKRRRIWK